MLIDTHTHLDGFARRGELADVIARARGAGIERMIAIGTEPEDWALYRDLARAQPGVIRFSVGLHPCSVPEDWNSAVAQIESHWREGDVTPVALGECGLDRFHLPKEADQAAPIFARQQAAFEAQLAIARRLECPVVIHSRGAFRDCVDLISASGVDWSRVVFHCFAEGPAEIAEIVRLGGRGSFTGILTYKNAEGVRAAAKEQGLDRLMLETDAPYLTPQPHRGKPNEPAYLRHTAEAAAELFGVSLETLAERTTGNVDRFFGRS